MSVRMTYHKLLGTIVSRVVQEIPRWSAVWGSGYALSQASTSSRKTEADGDTPNVSRICSTARRPGHTVGFAGQSVYFRGTN